MAFLLRYTICRMENANSGAFTGAKSIPPFLAFASVALLGVCVGTHALCQSQNSIPASKPDLQQQYEDAEHLQASGNMEQAAFAYKLFLASALERLAVRSTQIGDFSRALPRFQEAVALRPHDNELLSAYAGALRDAHNLAQAKSLAEQLVAEQPKSAEAHALLGSILEQSGDKDGAIQQFETVVSLDPSMKNGLALAEAYLAKKDDKSAAKIFAEMLASAGESAAIHMDIGRAYGEAGFPDDAIVEFKKALAKDPKMPGLHYSLGASYMLSMGEIDYPKAAAEFHKELQLHPNDFLSYSQLGSILLSQHNYAEAEHDLLRATELRPDDPDIFLFLGQLYVDTQRPADAEAALRKSIALTVDPSRNHYQVHRAHYLLGRILLQSGRADEAKSEMRTSQDLLKLETLENQDKLPNGMAIETVNKPVFTQATPNPEAARELEKLEQRLSPAIADSYNNLGASTARDGNVTEAVTYFEKAAQWNPNLEGLDYNMARAAYSAKNYAKAVDPLSRYLRDHPDDVWFRSALGVSLFLTRDYSKTVETLRPMASSLQSVPALDAIYAAALVEIGNYSEGIDRLKQMEAHNPKSAEVHRTLANAYLRAGDKTNAEQEFNAVLSIDPADDGSQRKLALLKQNKVAPSAPQ
jgi:tetratricopeptide (TPR) repeat protein